MYLNRRTRLAHLLAAACGFAAALLLGLCIESVATAEEQADPERETKEQIASEVIFSHDRHTDRGFDCGSCHGEGDPAESGAEFRTMDMCFQCHEGRRGVEDCSVCHERAHILRPADHAFDWFHIHGEQARLGDERCAICHNRDYCQECHEGGRLLSARSEEVTSFTPYGPQLAAKQLLVQRAHDLDYTYTHALDASGKESDCLSCHSFESFCAGCHAPEDDPEKFLPLWHREAGWTPSPPGVGSGGGAHGEMARRDMELCAACHEVEIGAEDPTCLQCHRDFCPGRGNDPSTHAPGFAGDAGRGDWHDDGGAVCYICHIRESGGDRFCGYCHEEHGEEEEQ
jgi:hypothetical protein